MDPGTTLAAFDRYLRDRGLALDAIVVGGAALNLLGILSRQTRDCDIIQPTLSAEIAAAANAFAADVRKGGGVLRDDWLNNGPASLVPLLPKGWEDRLVEAFRGEALPWLEVQDLHPGWPKHVRATLDDLYGRLGHGV